MEHNKDSTCEFCNKKFVDPVIRKQHTIRKSLTDMGNNFEIFCANARKVYAEDLKKPESTRKQQKK